MTVAKRKEGWEYKPKLYRLRFEDEDLAGLVVMAKSPSIGSLASVLELVAQVEDLMAAGEPDMRAVVLATRDLVAAFAGFLVEWNLTEGGEPVVPSKDALTSRDLDFGMAVVKGWIEAVSSAPPPLPQGSSATPQSGLEHGIPMEPLSGPPPS